MKNAQYHFQNLVEKLAIDETDLGNQITEWKECLEDRLSVDFVRKSGSTKRGTNLDSSDVDLIVLFDEGRVDNSTPEHLFATTESDIKSCFGEIKQMDHGFIYEELSNTTVDIVIGFADRKNHFLFYIPDKRNGKFAWIETSPDASEKRIKDANCLTSGKAGSYVRLMKYWNLKNQKCLNSFYLETLVIKKILSDSENFNKMSYDEGIHFLFRYLQTAIERKESQPSGKGPKLGDLNDEEKKSLRKLLDYNITLSGDALDGDKLSDQIGPWEMIFGKEFTS